MASNLYQVLEANEAASQATLQTLFEQKTKRLQQESEEGNPTAKAQLWALKQAYETLSNPAKRAAYDDSLREANIKLPMTQVVSDGPSWKLNAMLVVVLAAGLIGLGLYLGRAKDKDDHSAKVLLTNRSADNDATRAGTERVLVEGAVNNGSKIIDRSAELGNRALDIQQDAENRRRQEMEYRAQASAEAMRLEQERLKLANDQLASDRTRRDEEMRAQEVQNRLAMERIQSARRRLDGVH